MMLRWILVGLVLLVVGLAINLGLAWGFSAYVPPRGQPTVTRAVPLSSGNGYIGHSQMDLRGRTIVFEGHLNSVEFETDGQVANVDWAFGPRSFTEIRAGWPMRAWACRNYGDVDMATARGMASMSITGINVIEHGIRLKPPNFAVGSPAQSWRALPYRPIWPGAAVNTIVFAIALIPLVWLPTLIRRRVRRHRRQCVGCGYPIGESPVCTECGAALPGQMST